MSRLTGQAFGMAFIVLLCGCAAAPEVEQTEKGDDTTKPDMNSTLAGRAKRESMESLFDDIAVDTPGAAFVVVEHGRIVAYGGFGLANLQYDIPMTARTVVDIGSVSKQITAFGVLLLVEDGLLSLDDDIRQYIPELPDYGDVMTLRHLLTHTSGLREWIQLLHLSGYKIGGDIVYRDHVFNLIVHQKGKNFGSVEFQVG